MSLFGLCAASWAPARTTEISTVSPRPIYVNMNHHKVYRTRSTAEHVRWCHLSIAAQYLRCVPAAAHTRPHAAQRLDQSSPDPALAGTRQPRAARDAHARAALRSTHHARSAPQSALQASGGPGPALVQAPARRAARGADCRGRRGQRHSTKSTITGFYTLRSVAFAV